MTKILFVCLGNICRSPMAEFLMKDMVKKLGMEEDFYIESAGTSDEEQGNPVYPPAKVKLAEHGISCEGKTARQICPMDYACFDLIIGMEPRNLRDMERCFGEDYEEKVHNLLDYAGREGEAIADPWYTGDFESTWQDLSQGCEALLNSIIGNELITLDFSHCKTVPELYWEMRGKMNWEEWYGNNLDALYDILTGLPHDGIRFEFVLPDLSAPFEVREYVTKIRMVFNEAAEYNRSM